MERGVRRCGDIHKLLAECTRFSGSTTLGDEHKIHLSIFYTHLTQFGDANPKWSLFQQVEYTLDKSVVHYRNTQSMCV